MRGSCLHVTHGRAGVPCARFIKLSAAVAESEDSEGMNVSLV